MKILQNVKNVVSLAATVASTATHTVNIDRKDFGYAQIAIITGTTTGTSIPLALKLEEGDTTSSYAPISAFALTNSFTATTKTTNEQVLCDWHVALCNCKRHLKVSITPGESTVIAVHAQLTEAAKSPTTLAAKGVTTFVTA